MRDLQRTLQELAVNTESVALDDAFQQAVDAAAGLYDVTGAGVMLADGEHVLHYAAASDGHGRELERIQEQAGAGPCVTALIVDEVIETADATTDPRWPEIHDALQQTTVRAVLGLPIHIGGTVIGSLDVYRENSRPWPRHEVDGLVKFSTLVEHMLAAAVRAEHHERTVEQLTHALEHRVMIERAVGMLMERHDIDAVAAFQRLRSTARDSRRKAADVAAEILSR